MKWKATLLLGLLLCLVGCGETKYPVSGVVKYKDQPLPNVNVVMLRSDGMVATAVTDASGAFANVTTEMPGDGAPLGKYKVSFTPVSTVTENPDSADAYAAPPKPPFPAKYMMPETSFIEIEVKPDLPPVEWVMID